MNSHFADMVTIGILRTNVGFRSSSGLPPQLTARENSIIVDDIFNEIERRRVGGATKQSDNLKKQRLFDDFGKSSILADSNILELAERAGDFFPAHAVAWAAGSAALFRFSRAVTSSAVPGFPAEFLAILSGSRNLRVTDYGKVFVSQIDTLFQFTRTTKGRQALFLPRFSRSVLASLTTIAFVSLVLSLSGFGVWSEAVGFLTGESINDAFISTYDSSGISEQLRNFHLIMGVATGGIAFLINLYADYFSLAQTRLFIEKAKLTKGLQTIIVVLTDFLVSVLILFASITLGLFTTCVLTYVAGFFVWETFAEYFQYLFVPALAVSFALLYDSLAFLFGAQEVSGDVINSMSQWTGVPIGFPTPKLIFLTWVCSSLFSSAWLWLNLSAIGLAKLLSFAPTLATAIIKWTKAREDPHRLVATFIVVVWSVAWVLPLGSF